MSDLQLRGLWHLVRLVETQLETSSGIAMPESYWKNDCCGLVLQSGHGLELDGGGIVPPMAQPGDLVLFDLGDWHPLQGKAREGFVWDPRVAGWLACDPSDSRSDRVVPAGEWVLVEPDVPPAFAGNIHLTERAKHPYAGTVLDVGPGRLVTCGPHRGWRLPVEEICGREIVGQRVHWHEKVQTMYVGRQRLQWQLVKASDLDCCSEISGGAFVR